MAIKDLICLGIGPSAANITFLATGGLDLGAVTDQWTAGTVGTATWDGTGSPGAATWDGTASPGSATWAPGSV